MGSTVIPGVQILVYFFIINVSSNKYPKPATAFFLSAPTLGISGLIRGTQRLFSGKYLFGEAKIAYNFLQLEEG